MRRFDSDLNFNLPLFIQTERGADDSTRSDGGGAGYSAEQRNGSSWQPPQQEQPYSTNGKKNYEENPAIESRLTEREGDRPASHPGDSRLPDWDIAPHPVEPIDGNGSRSSALESASSGDAEAVQPETNGFWPVLNNRNFLVLWSGQVFSQLADKVYLVLMIMIITSRFQGEGQTISGWVSAIMIAFTIPAVLFGSIAGVFVDHWPKRLVLAATNLLRGGLVLALPALLWVSQGWSPFAGLPIGFWALLGITFLVSTLTQFFAPAEQAVIPLIVDRRHLLSANSLYTTTMMASVIVGFAVGEPLLAIANVIFEKVTGNPTLGKEVLVGASYAIAGILLLLLKTNERANAIDTPPPHVWENIRDGLRYLGKQHRVRAACIQLVILFSIFAALAVLAVRMAEVMPALKSSQFGFLLAAGGVGMGVGAFVVGHYGQRYSRIRLALAGSIGVGISLGVLSLFTVNLVPALLILVCVGAFAALVGVPMQTTIQEETPEEMRGKVFGLQNNAINIALSLPLALAGVAEAYFGLRVVLIGLGLLAIVGGILGSSISREKDEFRPSHLP